MEQLRAAFKGAHGVFSMTAPVFAADFNASREAEARIGKNIADAAKAEGVQHLIWRFGSAVEEDSLSQSHISRI